MAAVSSSGERLHQSEIEPGHIGIRFGGSNQFTIAEEGEDARLLSACTSIAAYGVRKIWETPSGAIEIDEVLSDGRGIHLMALLTADEFMHATGQEAIGSLSSYDVLSGPGFSDFFRTHPQENTVLDEHTYSEIVDRMDRFGHDIACLFSHGGETLALSIKTEDEGPKRYYLFDSHGKEVLRQNGAYLGVFNSPKDLVDCLNLVKPAIQIEVGGLGEASSRSMYDSDNAMSIAFVTRASEPPLEIPETEVRVKRGESPPCTFTGEIWDAVRRTNVYTSSEKGFEAVHAYAAETDGQEDIDPRKADDHIYVINPDALYRRLAETIISHAKDSGDIARFRRSFSETYGHNNFISQPRHVYALLREIQDTPMVSGGEGESKDEDEGPLSYEEHFKARIQEAGMAVSGQNAGYKAFMAYLEAHPEDRETITDPATLRWKILHETVFQYNTKYGKNSRPIIEEAIGVNPCSDKQEEVSFDLLDAALELIKGMPRK